MVWQLATTNPGKVADWTALLASHDIEARPIVDLTQIEEVGHTCLENARSKAVAVVADLPVLADDVGLWVDAMDGQPGLHLKRWAHSIGGWSAARDALGSLAGTRAEFRIGVALAHAGQLVASVEVTTPGILCATSLDGPGVQPCFVPDGCTVSLPELPGTLHARVHYRSVALRALFARLDGRVARPTTS